MPKFVPNRNLPRELSRATAYKLRLVDSAKEVVDNAKTIARAEAYDDGDYHDSIRVHVDGDEVYASAFDFKARWIEEGSVNNPPSAPLRRGTHLAGLKFKASSRG